MTQGPLGLLKVDLEWFKLSWDDSKRTHYNFKQAWMTQAQFD